MAEAFLTVLLENLNSLVQRRIGLLLGVDKEMRKFSSILSTISAVLEDAEENQLTDRAIKNWLQKLNDLSFELDDVLDDCESEAFRLKLDGQNLTGCQKVRSSLSCLVNPKNVLFRFKIANKMKEIGERLDEIANERMKFHLREFDGERRDQRFRKRRETSSIIAEPHVYGREQDKEKIVGFLVKDAMNCEDLSIYSIVGLGGMGKTTLAQLVYNDPRVEKHFELKMWVCVSEDFDVKRLVKAIIESATGTSCEALDMDPLQKRLQEILRRKRYLLVLDDVWNEDHDQWDKLKYALTCGSNGASIVVTTRLQKVAWFMGAVPMHHLSGLSEDDCWLLFKQRAFGNEGEDPLDNLVMIGKEMVRKCKGVPLAAKALGSLMCFKREEREWLSVMQSELWNLPQDESFILPALRLSYFHLPIEQRRCFAYCAIFPKDYRIKTERLIHLWVANGLISSKGGLDAEEIGREILNELYWRSLIQDIEKNGFGDMSYFGMHDLVHDLAQSIMEDKSRIVEVDDNARPINLSKGVRHLICCKSQQRDSIIPDIPFAESLRTFIFQGGATGCSCNFKLSSVRAFHARLSRPSTPIPTLISNCKHLRYLNLSFSNIEILPESICSLNHLLTLDLSHCQSLQKLPKHTSHLKSLRHLYIYGCSKLSCTPPNVGRLTCLKTLTSFTVNRRKGCRLDELCNLNIGGLLCINNLEKVGSPTEAKSANLSRKSNLRELELSWSQNENESEDKAEQVLDALAPSSNLQMLTIYNYKGVRFPYWFGNEILQNVTTISLSYCKNCSELPPFGKLPLLQDLSISGMNFVRYLDIESYDGDLRRGFACLETLRLYDLPNLERLSREAGKEMFPCLSRLDVHRCPNLTLPDLESVKGLRVYECSESLLKSTSRLPGLTRLHISRNDQLTFFPEGMLQNLKVLQSLIIDGFTKLQEFPPDMLIALNALEVLRITFCPELRCLPEGIPFLQGTTNLKDMGIRGCKKLKSLSESFQFLTALQSLVLVDCPELEGFPSSLNHLSSLQSLTMSRLEMAVLPEALQHLPSLKVMTVAYFSELMSLPDWLGNLTSLRDLRIEGCPGLPYIPTSVKNLSNLRNLRIESCPKLEKRYQKEVGEDWQKISHISDLYVGPKRLLL